MGKVLLADGTDLRVVTGIDYHSRLKRHRKARRARSGRFAPPKERSQPSRRLSYAGTR